MTMKTKYATIGFPLVFLLLALFASCEKSETNPENSKRIHDLDSLIERNLEKVTLNEGLTGTIITEEGNCMPYVSEEPEPNPDCKIFPVARTIRIYEYTTRDQVTTHPDFDSPTFFSHVETELVQTITSDTDGFFETALSPGKYSLFVEEKGALYANLWDSDGGIHPVVVEEGEMTAVLFKITHSAVY